MLLNTDQIAEIAHEANRAYCQTIGDLSQPTWAAAPEWQRKSAVNGVIFHVTEHLAGRVPPPSASHNSWLAEKKAEGWSYGPVKDPDAKQHPCFLPFDQLPIEQRLKDFLFGHIVAAFIDAEKAAQQA